MRVLVTGFGPFGGIADNPSAWLAERLGHPHTVVEVSFQAVDELVVRLAAEPPDVWLQLGVAAGSRWLRQELFARNRVGSAPDVRGETREGPIDPSIPACLGATLWGPRLPVPSVRLSFDAGTYLCNYLFFRALVSLPATRIGFLHVPATGAMPLETQLQRVRRLTARLLEP